MRQPTIGLFVGTAAGVGILLMALGSAVWAQPAQTTWTITVDCQAGQSINEALAQAAPELTVEVRGQCVEDVVVRRDAVTLRGIDPLRDGIRSPGSPTGAESTLVVRDASRVTIANLSLSGGRREGLKVVNSTEEIVVSNSRFESNGVWGASMSDSDVTFVGSIFTGNGGLVGEAIGGGLIAARGSEVACSNCSIEFNPQENSNLGAVAFTSSTLRLIGSRVEGDTALLAQSYSRILVESTEIIGATWSFQANIYGTVRATGGTLSGPFLGMTYSTVELFGVTQVLNQLQNFVSESSQLIADQQAVGSVPTTLTGLTLVTDYSTGRIVSNAAIEALACGLGGDVTCDATVVRGSASGCASCPARATP